MSYNPYAPPKTEIAANAGSGPVYSPRQVAAGAFIGGPVGLIYFLRENFLALGNVEQARKSLIWGAVLIVALLVILPLLPDKFPSIAFTVGYMAAGQQIASTQQLTREAIDASTRYTVASNWRVFGRGLVCMFGSMVVIFTPILLLGMMGVSYGS